MLVAHSGPVYFGDGVTDIFLISPQTPGQLVIYDGLVLGLVTLPPDYGLPVLVRQAQDAQGNLGAVADCVGVELVGCPEALLLESAALPSGEQGADVRVQCGLVPAVRSGRQQRKAVLDQEEVVGVGAVADEELVAGLVAAGGDDGEGVGVEGDVAAWFGAVVEEVGDGLQGHVVVLGPAGGPAGDVVEGAGVDEEPGVEEVVAADARVDSGDESAVLVELGLLLAQEGGGARGQQGLQLERPADGHAGSHVLRRGQDALPGGEGGRVTVEAEADGEDGVHSGTLEATHNRCWRAGNGAQSCDWNSEDLLVNLGSRVSWGLSLDDAPGSKRLLPIVRGVVS